MMGQLKTLHMKIEVALKSGILKLAGLLMVFAYLVLSGTSLQATHIVGGQLSYKSLGKGWYEIQLVVRRDCKNGADTVYFDNPALIGVFYGDNQKAFRIGTDGVVQMEFHKDDTLTEKPANVCISRFEEVCVHEAVYTKRIFLPFDERGYYLVYQRCCRNQTLTNIVNPLETGTTYAIRIFPNNLIDEDSSPQFGDFPPIYTCVNKPFRFDHSATDLDGDSLAYVLCSPNLGKTRLNPADRPDPPPYDSVLFRSPFSLSDLLNGGSGGGPLRINPVTGEITAEPNILGQFLVGVCVLKYRNGQLIGKVIRDFELNVVACGVQPTAGFDVLSEICDGLKQTFKNTSTDALDFEWYFDFSGDTSLKSVQKDPVFTYPRPGVYQVVMIARTESCFDTFRRTITIIDPALMPDFDIAVECMPDLIIRVTDKSTSAFPIVTYNWTLTGNGNNLSSSEKNPVFILSRDGKLTINLTITDSNGCTATASKMTEVKGITTDLIGNEVQICRGQSIRIVRNPDTTNQYFWDPLKWLDITIPSNPLAKPDSTITYKVRITNGLCTLDREITVFVKDSIQFKVTGDTATCDGKISLMAMSDSTDVFEWSFNPLFSPVEARGGMFMTTINGDRTVYVRAGTKEQCQSIKSIRLLDHTVRLTFDREHLACAGDTVKLRIRSLDPTDSLKIEWQPDSLIVSGQGTREVCILSLTAGSYVIRFKAINQFGCSTEDSIRVVLAEAPNVDFTIDTTCGSLTVKVNTNARGKIKWDFGDGVGMATTPMAEYTYKLNGKYTITLTVDTICTRSASKMVNVFFIKPVKPMQWGCLRNCIELNPEGDPTLDYMWSPGKWLDDSTSYNPKTCIDRDERFYVKITHPDFPDCPFYDTVDVRYYPDYFTTEHLELPDDTTLCEKGSILLEIKDDGNVLDTIVWCDSKGMVIGSGKKINVQIDTTTFFVIKLQDKNGCSYKDTVHVTLYILEAEILGPDEICYGDTVMLQLDTLLPDGHTYKWTPRDGIIGPDDQNKVTIFPDKTTTYTLTVDNGKGCTWDLSHTVIVSQLGRQIFANADPAMVVPGFKTQLTTVMGDSLKYNWGPNDGSLSATDIYNPVAMPMKTTTYTVTVTDEFGCISTASVTVMVKTCEEAVFLPNAFSPNNDGKNDFFLPRSDFPLRIHLEIYTRWGEKVFETDEATPGWDGTFKGDKLPSDVYGYFMRYNCVEQTEFTRKGNVSLLK